MRLCDLRDLTRPRLETTKSGDVLGRDGLV